MKKIIAGILASVTILSIGSVAFATGTAKTTTPIKAQSSSAIANNQAIRAEVLAARATIMTNEAQIKQLRTDIRTALVDAKKKIEALKADPTVTQAQLDAIKAALASVKDGRKAFATAHKDVIKNIYPDLKVARQARDYDTIKAKFDAIIAEQQSRIADLQKILDSVKSILVV